MMIRRTWSDRFGEYTHQWQRDYCTHNNAFPVINTRQQAAKVARYHYAVTVLWQLVQICHISWSVEVYRWPSLMTLSPAMLTRNLEAVKDHTSYTISCCLMCIGDHAYNALHVYWMGIINLVFCSSWFEMNRATLPYIRDDALISVVLYRSCKRRIFSWNTRIERSARRSSQTDSTDVSEFAKEQDSARYPVCILSFIFTELNGKHVSGLRKALWI